MRYVVVPHSVQVCEDDERERAGDAIKSLCIQLTFRQAWPLKSSCAKLLYFVIIGIC